MGGVNMNKKCMMIIFVVLMLMGCGTTKKANESAPSKAVVVSKESVLDKMKEIFEQSGNTFSFKEVEKSTLEGERVNITLNDKENMQLFIYESSDKASEDAKRISADGFSYTKTEGDNGITSNVDWIAAPHFYKTSNIIILYLGTDEAILNKLSDNFGEQIAGS